MGIPEGITRGPRVGGAGPGNGGKVDNWGGSGASNGELLSGRGGGRWRASE